MTENSGKGAYNKIRFDWKKQVNASHSLPRGAKHMASHLCDKYVNKDTGCFWPSNARLAKDFAVDERTIQRWLRPLKRGRWIKFVRIKNIRRAFQICFPEQAKGDSEHGKLSPSGTTILSPQHDKTVTPYKNQVYNQEKRPQDYREFGTVLVADREEHILSGWKHWLEKHTSYDLDMVLNLLRTRGGYMLPVRYPVEKDKDKYLSFFKSAIASEGFRKS